MYYVRVYGTACNGRIFPLLHLLFNWRYIQVLMDVIIISFKGNCATFCCLPCQTPVIKNIKFNISFPQKRTPVPHDVRSRWNTRQVFIQSYNHLCCIVLEPKSNYLRHRNRAVPMTHIGKMPFLYSSKWKMTASRVSAIALTSSKMCHCDVYEITQQTSI